MICKTTLLGVIAFMCVGTTICVADILVFGEDERELHGHILSRDEELTNVELLSGGLVSIYTKWIGSEQREPLFKYIIRRGDYYLQQGNRDRAWTEYQNAMAIAPERPEVRERLNKVIELERYERCRQALSDNARLINERNYREAIAVLETLLDSAPEQLKRDMVYQLAETYAIAGYHAYDHTDNENAERRLAKAESLNPDSPMYHFVRGRMLHDRREYEEAHKHYMRALQGNPNIPRLREYLERVEEELVQRGGF